ncbi:MAG: hypothetical protein IKH78_02495 [Ruminococcus sp.]|nr:hypothetical protein [Ruminococcus sp.]
MKDKTFRRIIALITAVGLLTSGGLVWYTCHLRENCSIVSYVANGR